MTRYRVQLPPIEHGPEEVPWEETPCGLLMGLLVLLTLFLGIPFLFWLLGTGVAS